MSVSKVFNLNHIDSQLIKRKPNTSSYVDFTMKFIEELVKTQETTKQKEVNCNSNYLKKLENILGTTEDDIKENFTKDNGKINIMDLLEQYGNDISSNDLKDLKDTICGLYKEGAIDDIDYFTALKWINEKIMQKEVKLKVTDIESRYPESEENILNRILYSN